LYDLSSLDKSPNAPRLDIKLDTALPSNAAVEHPFSLGWVCSRLRANLSSAHFNIMVFYITTATSLKYAH
jgi:hypothetical protein